MSKGRNKMNRKMQEQYSKQMQEKVQRMARIVVNQYHFGESKDIKVAVKFNDKGQIDEFKDPKVELRGTLENLDPKTREHVENALVQYMQCINQAIGSLNAAGKAIGKKLGTEIKQDMEKEEKSAA